MRCSIGCALLPTRFPGLPDWMCPPGIGELVTLPLPVTSGCRSLYGWKRSDGLPTRVHVYGKRSRVAASVLAA